MLIIRQPAPDIVIDGGCLARAYGLTAKERELVCQLAQGGDLRGASGAMGMSYHTARHHLRHVFAKTETHRQSELLRLVLAGDCAQRR